jgi:hypothetical protein
MNKIEFEINYAKALESILYILSKRPSIKVLNLLQSIYAADKYHLNTHCRPVTGDTYFKTDKGLIPSAIYDMVKDDPLSLSALEIDKYPFTRLGQDLRATRSANVYYLSKSDIEALDHGMKEYLDLSFSQVKMKNQRERCWLESEINKPIDFELIIENKEILDELKSIPFRLVV